MGVLYFSNKPSLKDGFYLVKSKKRRVFVNSYERIMKKSGGWCKKCGVTPLITEKDKKRGFCFRCEAFRKKSKV
jgi:hypothetical protein